MGGMFIFETHYCKCVLVLFLNKVRRQMVLDLKDDPLYQTNCSNITKTIAGVKGGERLPNVDLQDTLADSVDLPTLCGILTYIMSMHTVNASAAHAVFSCCYSACGRFDDASFVKLADVVLPFEIDAIGNIPYSMLIRIDNVLLHKREIARIKPKCSHNY